MNNATYFKRVAVTFGEIRYSKEIRNAWLEQNNSAVDTQVTALQVGDTFAFQLDESRGYRLGVAQVVSVEGTSGGRITLNVKIQTVDN